jgi:hypothetical protein
MVISRSRPFHAAARQLEVLGLQGLVDVGHRDAVGRHAVGVEPDADGEALLAADDDGADALHGLQAFLHHVLGDRGEFQGGVPLAEQGDPHDGIGVRILLGDHRFLDVIRQGAAHARHPVAHVLRGRLDFAREVELDGDAADLFPAFAGQLLDALDAVDGLFQLLGDFRLHHGCVGARVDGDDADHRRVDVGQFPHGQAGQGHQPEQDQGQIHHGGQDRPLDAEFG